MSFLFVSVVLGFTVFLSSFLKLVPFPVLYGVFLYMGVSSIGGIQFIDRLFLLLMPVKHHPSVSYIRRVRNENFDKDFVKLIHSSWISRKKNFFIHTGTHMENAFFHYCAILWFGPIMGGQIVESHRPSIPIFRSADGTIKNDSSIFTLDF